MVSSLENVNMLGNDQALISQWIDWILVIDLLYCVSRNTNFGAYILYFSCLLAWKMYFFCVFFLVLSRWILSHFVRLDFTYFWQNLFMCITRFMTKILTLFIFIFPAGTLCIVCFRLVCIVDTTAVYLRYVIIAGSGGRRADCDAQQHHVWPPQVGPPGDRAQLRGVRPDLPHGGGHVCGAVWRRLAHEAQRCSAVVRAPKHLAFLIYSFVSILLQLLSSDSSFLVPPSSFTFLVKNKTVWTKSFRFPGLFTFASLPHVFSFELKTFQIQVILENFHFLKFVFH